MEKNKNPLRRIYDWTLSLAERRLSGLWLGLLSFAEASFFPIPPDVLLLPLCLGIPFLQACKFLLGESGHILEKPGSHYIPGKRPDCIARESTEHRGN